MSSKSTQEASVGKSKAKQSEAQQSNTQPSVAVQNQSLLLTEDYTVGTTKMESETQSVGATEGRSSFVKSFMAANGTARRLRPDQQSRLESKFFVMVGAKTKEQKDNALDALVCMCVTHGASPNVAWEEIDLTVPSVGVVNMGKFVDGVVTRAKLRKFMVAYSSRVDPLLDASPELTAELVDRAVRNGLPVTQAKYVIDFYEPGGVNPEAAGWRHRSKYAAVSRAETSGDNGLVRASQRAVIAGERYTTRGGNGSSPMDDM